MNKALLSLLLQALLLTTLSAVDCHADYKNLLFKGTTRDEVRDLYDQYVAKILKAPRGEGSSVLEALAGGKDFKQSFLLACVSNGWPVRAVDLDRQNAPPSGTWAYTEEDYGGIVRQFPSDCNDMHCMDIASVRGFQVKSLLLGTEVRATLYTQDGFRGKSIQTNDSCPVLEIPLQSMRLRHAPRIDYVTISDYETNEGRASFRLHVSGANIDDGATLLVDKAKTDSEIEVRLDNSSWLGLGKDAAQAGYNLDPTFYAFPVLHYDSIVAAQVGIPFGQTISIEVHNSMGQVSNTLLYEIPSPDKLDSDGDGLLDAWETCGVDGLDLVALGANPHRKDVYVEVDRMVVPGRIWSDFSETDYPSETTFVESVRSYAAAPVINPDRSTGIALHIDYGQEKFEKAAKSEGGTEIPWRRFLGYKRSDDFRRKYPEYYDAVELRNDPAFFPRSRSRVFRYCVFGDQQWSSRSTGGGNFESTFFLTLGISRMNAVKPSYQTGVFLHELGHMFGLSHQGSGKAYNYKPNFNSVMNYQFVFEGCDMDGKLGGGMRDEVPGDQVYSYSEGMRAKLDEGALREVLGVANHYPHDWNGDGVINNDPVKAIISKHRQTSQPRILRDSADWAKMKFKQLDDPKIVARDAPPQRAQQPIRDVARVPRGVDIGFKCEVGGIIQTGHWKVVGTVTAHEPGKVTFRTEPFRVRDKVRTEAKTGHLAYQLPEDLLIPVQVGDPITILHDDPRKPEGLQKHIHIASGKQLILATSRLGETRVPRSADRAELLCQGLPAGRVIFYWSDPDDDDREQPLKEMPPMPSAATITAQIDSQPDFVERARKGYQPIKLGKTGYLFRILDKMQQHGDAKVRDAPEDSGARTNDGLERFSSDGQPDAIGLLIRSMEADPQ
ncbi:MAG: hypothetical protein AAGD07_00835 [Planctomycetota bacterium]